MLRSQKYDAVMSIDTKEAPNQIVLELKVKKYGFWQVKKR